MIQANLEQLIGKTIKAISEPDELVMGDDSYSSTDDNILVEFTDGTILKLASWDYEGYASGIYKEIVDKKEHSVNADGHCNMGCC